MIAFPYADATLFVSDSAEILLTYPEPDQPHYITLCGDALCGWHDLPSALAYIDAEGLMLCASYPRDNVVYL